MTEAPRPAQSLFGDWHDAPITEDLPTMETPVGTTCPWCETEIKEGEAGIAIPCLLNSTPTEGAGWKMQNWHRECFIRSTVGSVAHQQGNCTCHAGNNPNPTTPEERRQEAIEACNHHMNRGSR